MNPMRGPGRFQWNTGGWFGGQIGATCWLVPMAFVLVAGGDQAGGAMLAILFAAPNVIGTMLWFRRERVAPYPAFQLLILCSAISAFAAFFILIKSAVFAEEVRSTSLASLFIPLLIFPGLMFMFHLMEKQSRDQGDGE